MTPWHPEQQQEPQSSLQGARGGGKGDGPVVEGGVGVAVEEGKGGAKVVKATVVDGTEVTTGVLQAAEVQV